MKAHLKIVSDGTPTGTHILADDKELTGVTSVSYFLNVDSVGHATVTFNCVALEIEGDADLEATFEANIFADDADPYPSIGPAEVIRKATS